MAGKKKEAKSDEEFFMSTSSLPSSSGGLPPHNGDSSIRWPVDETNDKLKEELRSFAVGDDWQGAQSIFDGRHDMVHDMVRTPLTANGDRVLHIAVSANSRNFVDHLVNGVHMTQQDLEIQNNDGNTAFCVAAISGNATLLKIMMDKNENLPVIYGQDGMLPVHLAASSGHHEIVRLLSSDNLLLEMKYNDIERLFLMTISSDIFDVANKLFGKYRNLLAYARADENLLAYARADEKLTVLHILARKPSKFFTFDSEATKLFKEVWSHARQLALRNKLSTALFDAIKHGNDVAAGLILDENPELLTLKDSNGRSPLHYAALYRRESTLRNILDGHSRVNHIIQAVDLKGDSVLHVAASYQSREESSRLDIKLQRELAWFKEVDRRVPQDLRTMKNSEGQTPMDVFYDSHKKLSKEVKETAKGIGNSGMLVAALIATVAFTAAVTVPGDDMKSAWFVVFILTNAAALFASSASIISFLSIFTSAWFTDTEIIISQTLIKRGLVFLVISVVSMVLSFVAASFLIFGHIFKWVAYVVVTMGVPPILLLPSLWFEFVDRFHNNLRSFIDICRQISGCNFKSSSTAEDCV